MENVSLRTIKKIVPIALIAIIGFIFGYKFFFHGLLPIPADTIPGLYYPFRDIYVDTNPNGIAYHNSLITDPIRQEYPWRYLSITLEKKLQLPIWNPYDFAGTPLLGNMQSAPLYPLNILLFIFPFQIGWSLLVIGQPILAGIFLYLYLRKMNLSLIASTTGAVAFAFCGFNTAWLEWNTIGQVILWLPLILLAKETLIRKINWQWIILLIFAECAAILAGHLQTLFYSLIISNFYLLARVVQSAIKENSRQTYIVAAIKKYVPFLIIGIVIFSLTAIQWIPTVQFINQSARSIDQQDWHKAGWFLPQEQLVQFIAPDFFGNPATINYWGVWNYGEFVGYIGIIPLVFALFALSYRHDKKTTFFGTLFFFSLLFSLNTWLGQLPFILKIPLLSTAQPSRLLVITDFSLSILAALGLDYFLKTKKPKQITIPLFFVGIMLAGLWMYVELGTKLSSQVKPENILIAKHNLYLPTIFFVLTAAVICAKIFIKQKRIMTSLLAFLILITIIDLIRFSWKFNTFSPSQYLFPTTKAITYLQQKEENFRIMTTDDRILPPNFSIMYKLSVLDGYDPLYLQRYAELIAAIGRGKPDIQPPLGFNRIITPHRYDSPLIDFLGVKYVLSLSNITNPKLQEVFADGQTKIYKNNNVYPRAFFIKTITPVNSKQTAIETVFDKSTNLRTTAAVEQWENEKTSFNEGQITQINYTENKVDLTTETKGRSFLILTDNYYPSWHAKICNMNGEDCTETKIYRTDYTFRGIVVPEGKYRIIFYTTII